MEDEHMTDIETVNKWTDDVDEFDENIKYEIYFGFNCPWKIL